MDFPSTHLSLLRAMVQAEENQDRQDAWNEFTRAYEKRIVQWCMKHGVPQRNARDMAQEILIILLDKLPMYDSTKGRFRTWLSTVIRNAVISLYHRKTEVADQPVGGDLPQLIIDQLQSREAADELAASVDCYADPFMLASVESARARVDESSWHIFEQYVVNGRAVADIADELRITRGAVPVD